MVSSILSTASYCCIIPNSSSLTILLSHQNYIQTTCNTGEFWKREHKTNIGSYVFVVEGGEGRNGGRNEARIDIGKQSKEQTKQYQCVFLCLCFRHEKELQQWGLCYFVFVLDNTTCFQQVGTKQITLYNAKGETQKFPTT